MQQRMSKNTVVGAMVDGQRNDTCEFFRTSAALIFSPALAFWLLCVSLPSMCIFHSG